MGAGVAYVGLYVLAAVILVGFLGEAVGRPICRRLFGRPGIATASSAAIAVIGVAAIARATLWTILLVLLVWSWGWALGGSLTGEWRRTDAATDRRSKA
jgi:hypothetical protein